MDVALQQQLAVFRSTVGHTAEMWRVAAKAGDQVLVQRKPLTHLLEDGPGTTQEQFEKALDLRDAIDEFATALDVAQTSSAAIAEAHTTLFRVANGAQHAGGFPFAGRISKLSADLNTKVPDVAVHANLSTSVQNLGRRYRNVTTGSGSGDANKLAHALPSIGTGVGTGALTVGSLGWLEAAPIFGGAAVGAAGLIYGARLALQSHRDQGARTAWDVVRSLRTATGSAVAGTPGPVSGVGSARQAVGLLRPIVQGTQKVAQQLTALDDRLGTELDTAAEHESLSRARLESRTTADATFRAQAAQDLAARQEDWRKVTGAG